MRRHMKKKGALELSVNAIVIMVIAFVVLGLILTFTRTIFKFGTEKTTAVFGATSLDTPPDAENPITLSDEIPIKANGEKTIKVGYYNRNPFSANGAKFGVWDCKDVKGNSVMNDEPYSSEEESPLPTITSASAEVGPSDSFTYSVIFSENGLPSGQTYICTVLVYNEANDPVTGILKVDLNKRDKDNKLVYETKQVFLKIAA